MTILVNQESGMIFDYYLLSEEEAERESFNTTFRISVLLRGYWRTCLQIVSGTDEGGVGHERYIK